MSNLPPYNGYEPNDPWSPEPERDGGAYRASAAPTDWEEAGYLPNEPTTADADTYSAPPENRYTRPTWDEASYFTDGAALPRRRRARTAYDSPEGGVDDQAMRKSESNRRCHTGRMAQFQPLPAAPFG
jgi:hypothetical protein